MDTGDRTGLSQLPQGRAGWVIPLLLGDCQGPVQERMDSRVPRECGTSSCAGRDVPATLQPFPVLKASQGTRQGLPGTACAEGAQDLQLQGREKYFP